MPIDITKKDLLAVRELFKELVGPESRSGWEMNEEAGRYPYFATAVHTTPNLGEDALQQMKSTVKVINSLIRANQETYSIEDLQVLAPTILGVRKLTQARAENFPAFDDKLSGPEKFQSLQNLMTMKYRNAVGMPILGHEHFASLERLKIVLSLAQKDKDVAQADGNMWGAYAQPKLGAAGAA